MKIFPTKEIEFKLLDSQVETLERLKRRTELSENLTSQITNKSFRGIINGNQFKVISSALGSGAFCTMTGEINSDKGFVKIEIHKAFKVLLSILLLLPLIGISAAILTGKEQFSPVFILVVIGQTLFIRYVFVGIAFRFISNASLNRLRDVLDFE